MKRILVFSHALEIGGAERALLGLLEVIDTKKYSVDLFLMRHEGELMEYIPKDIKLLPEISQYTCLAVPFLNVLRKGQYGMAFGRYLGKKKSEKRANKLKLPVDNDVALQYSHKYTLPFVPPINDVKYDLAISFLTPHYFVAEKVTAKKKIAWIHTDYSVVAVDKEEQLRMWNCYDKVISISDAVTYSFLKNFSELQNKIVLVKNIMPMQYMEKLSCEPIAQEEMPDDGSVKLLSIGRFCTAKNFDNIPNICRKIRGNGINVKWYIIGFGADEELIRSKINEENMEDYVKLLGKKENPYPYIKKCDIYVQPSRYEGNCVSVREAQILNKPVIITAYPTSASQIENNIDGIIVPMDNAGCAKGIGNLIRNNELKAQLIHSTVQRDYVNAGEVEKLYKMLDML